ncbi:hypothetical protein U1Q18_048492 [Sarracenia purpurea var. burkii]
MKRESGEIASFATSYTSEYQQVITRMKGATMNKARDSKWEPPTNGRIKANFDGTHNKDGKTDIGVILRDDKGIILTSCVNSLRTSTDSDHVESLGALMVVDLAKRLNVNKLHLEGDLLSVINAITSTAEDFSLSGAIIEDINAITSTAEDFSLSGAIIEDIKSLLRGFRNSICTHIPRMGNSVAHALSRLAISMGKPFTWSCDTHQALIQIVEDVMCSKTRI